MSKGAKKTSHCGYIHHNSSDRVNLQPVTQQTLGFFMWTVDNFFNDIGNLVTISAIPCCKRKATSKPYRWAKCIMSKRKNGAPSVQSFGQACRIAKTEVP